MTESETLFMSFDEMNLKALLLRGIFGYGYERPSLIQQKAIVPILTKRDIIAQAQSGTGKTGTFTIGMLQNIDINLTDVVCQAIILSPTKELAEQTYKVVNALG
jgi:translation initiation factor 4A